MPPKKDNKKKGIKSDGPIVIDYNEFIREEVDLPLLGGVSSLDTPLSGDYYNIEELFPEWLDEENYSDIPEILKSFQIKYPNIIKYNELKSVTQILGLKVETEVENKKGIAAKKQPKDLIFDDAITAEDGVTLLPRIFIGSSYNNNNNHNNNNNNQQQQQHHSQPDDSTEFLSSELKVSFKRFWTTDQLERKNELERIYLASLPPPTIVHEPAPSARSNGKDQPSSRESSRPVSKDSKKVPSRAISPGLKKNEHEEHNIPQIVIPPPPVFPEEPSGDEIDPLLCHTFRLIERFYPSLQNNNSSTIIPYLWRAIYPQLPSGKPCYNKLGKYCVKLFVGGKWRKVSIIDVFPTENGIISIAGSSNSLELWPTILAKAIYTVFTACGYHHTISDLSFSRKNSISVTSFISFALHTLTGWLPSTPWSLKEVYLANSNRYQITIEEMSLSGVTIINNSNIPSESPILMPPDEQHENRQRTKKQFRDLLLRKKMEKENLIRDILNREEKIQILNSSVNKSFGEIYYIHAISSIEGEDHIFPILGMSRQDDTDFMEISFLIKWKTFNQVFSQGVESEDIPGSSPIEYEWVKIKDLCNKYQQIYICGLDTRLRTNYSAEWSWHWNEGIEKIEEQKGKSKKETKGKEKKIDIPPTILGIPSRGQDRGIFPPTLLKIDPTTLSNEVNNIEYISLSVNIQSDLVSPQFSNERDINDSTNLFTIVDDVIVILQEIRTDGEDPLVMRVQLAKQDLVFPINRTTFNIPRHKLPKDPVLFWVRLFTKSSVFLSFHSPIPIEVLDAKQIWQSTGGLVWELNGNTIPTHATSEQILFRIPIHLSSTSLTNEQINDSQNNSIIFFLHIQNRAIADTVSLVVIENDTGNTEVLPNINGNFFHLTSNRSITIIGRCFHNNLNIPEFSWKASVLSRLPIIPPESKINSLINDKPSKQRFYGVYAPNNMLRIFRDIVSVETTDFPIAFRLSCLPLGNKDELNYNSNNMNLKTSTTDIDISEDLWYIVRIFRKTDRQLIHEYFTRSLLQIYLLDRDGLVPDQDVNEIELHEKKSSKTPKTEKKKKGEVELVDFIIEVVIDEERMKVPDKWKSRYPFKFRKFNIQSELGDMDERYQDGIGQCHVREAIFMWQLDVLAGKFIKMQHDTIDLERYNSIKNKWEEDIPGRRARALVAKAYWNNRNNNNNNNNNLSIEDSVLDKLSIDLAEALDKEEGSVSFHEKKIKYLSKYSEYLQPDNSPNEEQELLSDDVILDDKNYLKESIEKWKATTNEASDHLSSFHELFRNNTITRIKSIQGQVHTNYIEASNAWSLRESYKLNVEKKNESLTYLLQRATDALITAFPNENEDPKAKKGAKGKK